jgi:hypothetical protein
MTYKALITVGACAFAGLAVLGVGRSFRKWRRTNLEFDFPLENLFV